MRRLALAALLLLAPTSAFAQSAVRAAPSQYGLNFNQEVTGTAAIVWSSATATTNQFVRLYAARAFCAGGTGSLTITNTSNSAVWNTTPGIGASQVTVNFIPGLTSLQSSSLNVTLGCFAGGAGQAGTLDIQADRY